MLDKDIIFNFIAGGLLISICGYITKSRDSYASGFVYGSLPLGAYYLYLYTLYTKNNNGDAVKYINGAFFGGILWVLVVGLLYLNYFNPIQTVVLSSILYFAVLYLHLYKYLLFT